MTRNIDFSVVCSFVYAIKVDESNRHFHVVGFIGFLFISVDKSMGWH